MLDTWRLQRACPGPVEEQKNCSSELPLRKSLGCSDVAMKMSPDPRHAMCCQGLHVPKPVPEHQVPGCFSYFLKLCTDCCEDKVASESDTHRAAGLDFCRVLLSAHLAGFFFTLSFNWISEPHATPSELLEILLFLFYSREVNRYDLKLYSPFTFLHIF